MIEYGGRKIDNPVDYERLAYAYYEGEKGDCHGVPRKRENHKRSNPRRNEVNGARSDR